MRDKGQMRAIVLGAVLGAVFGSLGAVLYRRSRRRGGTAVTKPIRPQQLVRLGTAMVAVLRQFAELLS